jgi:GNAT superfamily N-acetyltransferase
MKIREAKLEDAARLSEVAITSVEPFREIDFDAAGWERFVEATTLNSTQRRLSNDSYFCICALWEDEIVGFITIKDFEKIDQLFVDPIYQGLGHSRNLWDYAKEKCFAHSPHKCFWVRSSTYAIPVYERFGFAKVETLQTENGASYQLMKLEPNSES